MEESLTNTSGGVAIKDITISVLKADPSGDEALVTITPELDMNNSDQTKNYEILRRLLDRARQMTVVFSFGDRSSKTIHLHATDPTNDNIVFKNRSAGSRKLYLHGFVNSSTGFAYDIELLTPSSLGGRLYFLDKNGRRYADIPPRRYKARPVVFTEA